MESDPPKRVSYIHSDTLVAAADALPSNIGRASLTHNLVVALDLLEQDGSSATGDGEGKVRKAKVVKSVPATREELVRFHDAGFSSTGPPTSPASHHALNLALLPGFSSSSLIRLFESCVEPVYNAYEPDAVVLQCGCDGLAGDPCKEWNLDLRGMGEVVRRVVHGWGKRTLLLGGGGYSNENVARCWAYLTAVALGREMDLDTSIPPNLDEYEVFKPSFSLDVPAGNMVDKNTDASMRGVEGAVGDSVAKLKERYSTTKSDN
ncbi:hypothetical protein MNV49_005155 [Pseudohyphozyma bogoriensis]|nr:hypothetical protein MNV49_005155 [Pseudohyphozyma bogoriensis]